ncbi:MAG TPA: glycine cleavage system protein GcvH [Myxococcota bacterium]|nr:glycine cleavage system protein GcvH [Myxococcota bacterium]HNZ02909.1 glycine cleavage system protein GcvH [Myxococcota bacterium]HOD07949.1 glycine cleavage system protein GcvH [Myxococcota bacterium]HPB50444.1 glycine cleavage system protein GcvH [Myxococcota bacterium]HQP95716.1 glycine cleavage system protein GcvH [Myxococcota bacterium]
MSIPKDYRFTDSHEWVKVEEDNIVSIGITDYAQDHLGEIVSVEAPRVGDEIEKGEPIGMIDSQKASSEFFAPITGVVVENNELIEEDPGVINTDPYEEGWLVRVEVGDMEQLDELMTAEDYEEYLGRLEDE